VLFHLLLPDDLVLTSSPL